MQLATDIIWTDLWCSHKLFQFLANCLKFKMATYSSQNLDYPNPSGQHFQKNHSDKEKIWIKEVMRHANYTFYVHIYHLFQCFYSSIQHITAESEIPLSRKSNLFNFSLFFITIYLKPLLHWRSQHSSSNVHSRYYLSHKTTSLIISIMQPLMGAVYRRGF